MNNVLLTLIGLRAAALGLALGGQPRAAEQIYLLADAIAAGRASDEHMRTIAEKLAKRDITDADFDDAQQRIEADSARLQEPVG